jgi:hypothetical protein
MPAYYLGKLGYCPLQIPLQLKKEAAVEIGLWPARGQPGGLVEVRQRLGKLAEFEVNLAAQKVGVGQTGILLQRQVELLDSPYQIPVQPPFATPVVSQDGGAGEG